MGIICDVAAVCLIRGLGGVEAKGFDIRCHANKSPAYESLQGEEISDDERIATL